MHVSLHQNRSKKEPFLQPPQKTKQKTKQQKPFNLSNSDADFALVTCCNSFTVAGNVILLIMWSLEITTACFTLGMYSKPLCFKGIQPDSEAAEAVETCCAASVLHSPTTKAEYARSIFLFKLCCVCVLNKMVWHRFGWRTN